MRDVIHHPGGNPDYADRPIPANLYSVTVTGWSGACGLEELAGRNLCAMSEAVHLTPPLPSIERPYELLPLTDLVERIEAQYDSGHLSFELLAELVERAEAAERAPRLP